MQKRHLLHPAKRLNCLFLALFVLAFSLSAGHAQTPDDTDSRKLDNIAASLQTIDTTLEQRGLTDADLQKLHDQVSPLAAEIETVVAHLSPRLAAANARLEQLGPSPDPKAAHEEPQVTSDRATQQKAHDAIDALFKRAKLLGLQEEQAETQINTRRQALFRHSLFEHSLSIANPNFWVSVAGELPYDAQSAGNLVANWVSGINEKLTGWHRATFFGLIALVILLYWPLARLGRWVLVHESPIATPSPLRKFATAWWVAIIIVSLPMAALLAFVWIFQSFNLIDQRYQAFYLALGKGVGLIALTAGIGRGALAPRHPNSRLVRLPDAASRAILRLAITIAALLATAHVVEALIEAIGGSANLQMAIRGICAVLAAIVIIVSLWRFGAKNNDDEVFGPRVAESAPDWSVPLRVLLSTVSAVIIASALAGFIVFAGFIADQIVWVTGVLTIAMMASGLINTGIAESCKPTTPFGRNIAVILGLSQQSLDQLTILLRGATRAVAFVITWLLILAPWGIQSTDIPGYFRGALFGFQIDDIKISLSSIVIALVIFIVGYTITHRIMRWLETSYLPHTSMDFGLRNAIRTSFGYVGVTIAALLALAYVGVSFEKLAIVASALSIGIGFGLQSIVNNFVSGLIILWERAIRVGDWIVVGADEGIVRRINVRSTEIETFDRAAVIVPNSSLVTGVVKNFVRTDRLGRIKLTVDVDLGVDPQNVHDALAEILRRHELVLETPATSILFNGFDSSHMHFEVYCFVADIATMAATKSDLYFEVFRQFKPKGWLSGPAPANIVTLAGLEKFEPLLRRAFSASDGAADTKHSGA